MRYKRLQLGQGDLRLLVAGADNAKHRLSRPHGGMVEQTLIDVADLLNVERAKRDAPSLGGTAVAQLHPQHLQRLQQVQHHPVGNEQRASLF